MRRFSVLVFLCLASGAGCGNDPSSDQGEGGSGGVGAAGGTGGTDGGGGEGGGTDPCEVEVVAPPVVRGLDAFYEKYIDAAGIPILSSAATPDETLVVACRIARQMVSFRDDVRGAMIARGARIAIMAEHEVTTDIPEHSDLDVVFPDIDWDTRARGLGGTIARPATSCAEENLLCYPTDRYRGENILVHEFAHGMMHLGIRIVDPTFNSRLVDAFEEAIDSGLWASTYAASNPEEYWAEGVQSYFDTNVEAIPPNGIHNHVNTRSELQSYDPRLFALIEEYYGPASWTPVCP